ncbi:MAG: bifunctional precorrin-2 dehydrogenase/sirohydrochlorin ferrochelatase [Lachnospiraceae bacterium]|nr:bifunctional precorrin-2 dehydrogenase/sirohydrochlorin ferrochelatase [Lachnospiraceae bacterium]
MFFPVFIDLSEKEILVVGAGTIAERRVHTLCGFSGRITVVAPEISPGIRADAAKYSISICEREFSAEDLNGKELVLASTDDRELNRQIYRLCKEKGIMVNVCSDQSLCDFQFPSVVQKGEVIIGINASGKNHRLVKETRKRVERLLDCEESRYEAGGSSFLSEKQEQ